MLISKNTSILISIAENPGNFGATIYNHAFQSMSLDYVYFPCKVTPINLKNSILGIIGLGIKGCSVSMPHKIKVIEFIDELEKNTKQIGSINTIVNAGNHLIGYNTDFDSIYQLTNSTYPIKGKDALIFGAGGMARAIIYAIKQNGASNIYITNRTSSTGKYLADIFNIKYIPLNKINTIKGHLLINATSIGMLDNNASVFSDETIKNFDAVLDVVVSSRDTQLIKSSRFLNKKVITGLQITRLQAMSQFKLYTGQNLSPKLIDEAINKYYLSSK